jgi:iron(III) transport system substrate-binding protein
MSYRAAGACQAGSFVAAAILALVLAGCVAPAPIPGAPLPASAVESLVAVPAPGTGAWDPIAWVGTVAGAKREGRIVVSGAPSDNWRVALTSFAQDYPEIQVEYTGASARDFWPRIDQERAAGLFLWDVRIGGFGQESFPSKDDGTLDPVRPVLTLPEVTDEARWLGGVEGRFFDKQRQYLFAFMANAQSSTWVNRDFVPEPALESGRELTDPQWRGKMVLQDPRSGSGGAVLAALLYAYGEPFVRELLSQQDVVITSDARQQAEWVVRGRYPIAIGANTDILGTFRREGLGVNVRPIREPVAISTGFGGVHLVNRAPHPNAAKLFVNWLLTRDVHARIAPLLAFNSARLDVPSAVPESVAEPARLQEYIPFQSEELLPQLQLADRLARELVK